MTRRLDYCAGVTQALVKQIPCWAQMIILCIKNENVEVVLYVFCREDVRDD
jgi:hypothetical protein